MPHRIIDTNHLIDQFRLLAPNAGKRPEDAVRSADELIKSLDSNAIVRPIEIEFLAGILDPREMSLAEVFLGRFRIFDERRILAEDRLEARRIAKHVLRDSGRRDLRDCLIAAIASRLRREVWTKDRGLRRQYRRTRQRRS